MTTNDEPDAGVAGSESESGRTGGSGSGRAPSLIGRDFRMLNQDFFFGEEGGVSASSSSGGMILTGG